jgi:hypothetical protein
MGHVDLDPGIVTGIPAWADPNRHRQPGRAREQICHLEQFVGLAFGDLLHRSYLRAA